MRSVLQENDIKLVPLVEEHRTIFTELANIPEINCRVNEPLPYTSEHFDKNLQRMKDTANYYVWMIEYKGSLCGVINSAARQDPRIYQGGYWVHPTLWGKGLLPIALNIAKRFLLDECNAQRIQAIVEPDNPASIRVLEKCGYEKEGLLKKFYPHISRGLIDVFMYAYVKTTGVL